MLGILFALLALFSWSIGDFSVQRAVRVFGDFKTLLYIGVIGVLSLLPFVYKEVVPLFLSTRGLVILTLAGVVIFFAALFDFEALKRGKLSVVEPILALELPITIGLSLFFWHESLSAVQYILAGTTFAGILLVVSSKAGKGDTKHIWEKGVILAGAGSVIMGLVNFLVGVSSQTTSPLLTIWYTNLVFSFLCLIYLILKKDLKSIPGDIREKPRELLMVGIFDNAAWIFFAFATFYISISLATTISESYVALAALLGLWVNKEKLERHQLWGVAITVASVLFLSAISE